MFLDNPQLAMSDSVRAKARARQAKRRAILKKDRENYQNSLEKDCKRKAAWKSSLRSSELEEHKLKERIRLRAKAATSDFVASSGPNIF